LFSAAVFLADCCVSFIADFLPYES
jgi:hypothetical protein